MMRSLQTYRGGNGLWLERRSGWQKKSQDARTPGDVDYGRVIHSASFRRLQGKTQILNLGGHVGEDTVAGVEHGPDPLLEGGEL